MWNSILSMDSAKYMCLDIKKIYLTAPLDRFEYMKMPLALFPDWIKQQYNLGKFAYHGFVYLEMRCAVFGLPQAGILANELLHQRLLPHGYYKCNINPWFMETQDTSYCLHVSCQQFRCKICG